MTVLLQIDFPFSGPFGEAMTAELEPLARSINEEPGFLRKIWTENAEEGIAGGIYLFSDKASAQAYRDKHVARLQAMGVGDIRARVFAVNETLSAINGGDAALGEGRGFQESGMRVQVREARESDRPAIAEINQAAFGADEGPVIVGLTDELLADPTAEPRLALVATVAEQVVGYILLTAARLEPAQPEVAAALLAPMAVHPDQQNRGIGGRLIREGLRGLQAAGVDLVFVLGHPGFYSKFGFTPAGAEGFEAMYPIPPENAEAWMVQALRPEGIGQAHGRVVCADALTDPAYWVE